MSSPHETAHKTVKKGSWKYALYNIVIVLLYKNVWCVGVKLNCGFLNVDTLIF